MFSNFPQDKIDIVGQDGTTKHSTLGLFQGSAKVIVPDTSVAIEVGDEIRRILPNGMDEAFDVTDPVYRRGLHSIPDHYQVAIRRKGTFAHRQGGNYTFNVSGPNARVNFHSTDQSTNIVADRAVFGALRDAIATGIASEEERTRITAAVDAMDDAAGSANFVAKYQEFISSAASHMTIVAPLLPALTAWLSS
ncbi:hypothetical protein KHC28_01400 [Ancylobacter sonchi]|uniref:hypothetical protein n=1 Tax=Ancylobacter sonchi TaxID=1937790 RepID=UPI001BD5393A|nr:hypothetical protein [Ancylobacter sonchi]MBS7532308.1 hypothetical protein [Ancylobacter sonchi]